MTTLDVVPKKKPEPPAEAAQTISPSWCWRQFFAGLPKGFPSAICGTPDTVTAASGASTRELMHRMGHANMRAALIYQHATNDRDRQIAAALHARISPAQ